VNGHALLAIGSELSGGIENIRLENCKVLGEVWRVLRVKTNPERGGYVRNVSVKGVKAGRAKCAVFEITNGYSRWKAGGKKFHTEIENITLEDVVCEEGWRVYELRGDPEKPAKNVTVRNCELKHTTRGASIAENIEGLVVENVRSVSEPISIWCDDDDSKYKCGQRAIFSVHSVLTNGIAHVRLDNFGDGILREFDVDLSKTNRFTVEGARDIPGFLRLTVTCGKTVKRWGAVFSPDEITGGAERPADFVKFWREAVASYDRTVKEDVRLEQIDSLSTNGCNVYLLSLSDPQGRKVYGFLKEPKRSSAVRYPVEVRIPGAGPSVGGPACGDETTVGLTMNVHYYRPVPGAEKRSKVHNALQLKEDEYYNRLYPVAKDIGYKLCGIASKREDYFYYGAILAINRAVNYLRRRPNVDPDEFSYFGGSQGAGMGMALVAINGKFKKALFGVPAMTAHLCYLIDGRMAGWPRLVQSQLSENIEAARRNASYFDGVNFVTMITCPVVFSVGYTDTAAPPHAGYAAFNACPSKNKAIFGSIGFGHRISPVDSERMIIWLKNCGSDLKMVYD
jgi:cephalosporin-C deacetylase-like acetyl esterase